MVAGKRAADSTGISFTYSGEGGSEAALPLRKGISEKAKVRNVSEYSRSGDLSVRPTMSGCSITDVFILCKFLWSRPSGFPIMATVVVTDNRASIDLRGLRCKCKIIKWGKGLHCPYFSTEINFKQNRHGERCSKIVKKSNHSSHERWWLFRTKRF